jgi:hypothetical protein
VWWILGDTNVLKPTSKLTYADLNLGIRNMIICVEMVPFALFFHYAYSCRPYIVRYPAEGENAQTRSYKGGFLGLRAWLMVWDPRELLQAIMFAFESWGNLRRDESYELLQRRPPIYKG